MYKLEIDEIDEKILSTVHGNPGIKLTELSRAIDLSVTSTSRRILQLALAGELELERGRKALFIRPTTKTGGDQ